MVKIPKNILNREIKRVKALVDGEEFVENVPHLKAKISMRLGWETEDNVYIHSWEVTPYKKAPKVVKSLFKSIDFMTTSDSYEWLSETKAFINFDKRIKAACDMSEKLEKKYKGFNWFSQVLGPASGIKL